MLEVTKAIEASIGPKNPLNEWKLRYAGLCQFPACFDAGKTYSHAPATKTEPPTTGFASAVFLYGIWGASTALGYPT